MTTSNGRPQESAAPTEWLAALGADVRAATARLRSAMATVETQRLAASASVDRQLQRLDAAIALRPRVDSGERFAEVLAAVRRRDFGGLSPRDVHRAASSFQQLNGADVHALLQARPIAWGTFVKACLRDWDRLLAAPDFAGHGRLLCTAPATFDVLRATGHIEDVLSDTGPSRLAAMIHATTLGQAREWLVRRGFDAAWDYTAVCFAYWVLGRRPQAGTFEALLGHVREDLLSEAMLVPARSDGRRSWFSDAMRPARVHGSVRARGLFVAALLRAASSGAVDGAAWGHFVDQVLHSEFGDPRLPPLSNGWERVRSIGEAWFHSFLALLVADDLKLFFQWAMTDESRERFWLRYVGSVRRSVCVLDGDTHGRLTQRFAGADNRLAASIKRAQRFTKQSTGAQAFCLYFDRHVIVEFSKTGNAAYIYERAVFERQFHRGLGLRPFQDPNELKDKGTRADDIWHNQGWEGRAETKLAMLGIYSDRRARLM